MFNPTALNSCKNREREFNKTVNRIKYEIKKTDEFFKEKNAKIFF